MNFLRWMDACQAESRRSVDFSAILREGVGDFNRERKRVRIGDVRPHGDGDPQLGQRDERRRHAAQQFAVVADRAHLLK